MQPAGFAHTNKWLVLQCWLARVQAQQQHASCSRQKVPPLTFSVQATLGMTIDRYTRYTGQSCTCACSRESAGMQGGRQESPALQGGQKATQWTTQPDVVGPPRRDMSDAATLPQHLRLCSVHQAAQCLLLCHVLPTMAIAQTYLCDWGCKPGSPQPAS